MSQPKEQAIEMVDLVSQTEKIYPEISTAIERTIRSGHFIQGQEVQHFASELSQYMEGLEVIPCGNGTDALQIALMSLGLQAGDEVVVPAFTYAASAEVIALLGLSPVLVDVDARTYNIDTTTLEAAYSPLVKAIIPVHLFGHSADMYPILQWAKKNKVAIVEDNAQALGALYDCGGATIKVGSLGDISCTSFFPTKNLGCFGDGGAIMTHNKQLAERLRMIANHGQRTKYYHELIGCNSRLDSLQAAILRIKLRYLDQYIAARQTAAKYYTEHLKTVCEVVLPIDAPYHTYHQYTLRVLAGQRDALKKHLQQRGIPSMIYYPLPLCDQPAFLGQGRVVGSLANSRLLATEVLSLPMHTELTPAMQDRIIEGIRSFYRY